MLKIPYMHVYMAYMSTITICMNNLLCMELKFHKLDHCLRFMYFVCIYWQTL